MRCVLSIRFIILFFSFLLPIQNSLAMDFVEEKAKQERTEETLLIMPAEGIGQTKKKMINMLRLAGKTVVGLSVGLVAHCGLEFISTGAHELGHNVVGALLGGGWSHMTVNFTGNPLMPWVGSTDTPDLKHGLLLVTAAGPVVGILITYLQLLLLEKLDRCAKKPRRSKRCRSCRFFSRYTKMAKNVWARIFRKKIEKKIEEPSLALVTINCTKWYRWSRIIGGSIYGFTPLNMGDSPQLKGQVDDDGMDIWKDLLGKNIKGYKASLPLLVAIPMLSPTVIGLIKAAIMKSIS